MRGAVIYYSRWGHCKWVAEEIVGGLREAGHDVSLMEMRSINELDDAFDFLAVGCSTRGSSLPAPARRFIKRLDAAAWKGKPVAAFGTGLATGVGGAELQSADTILEALTSKRLRPVAPPFKALLVDARGPVVNGELLRALWFGRQFGAVLKELENKGLGKVSYLERGLTSRYSSSSREKRRKAFMRSPGSLGGQPRHVQRTSGGRDRDTLRREQSRVISRLNREGKTNGFKVETS